MAARLVAGRRRATQQGFFLNVSNYQPPNYETRFGTWISKCIAFANNPEEGGWRLGHYDWCASQYYSPFGPVNPDDISTWHYTDQWYDANLGHAVRHDALRGRHEPQRPGRRGPRPPAIPPETRRTGATRPPAASGCARPPTPASPLLDAYLWVKIPGESDGQCYRWTSGPLDPVRGIEDPAAGQWFPQMALELAHNASPPLP